MSKNEIIETTAVAEVEELNQESNQKKLSPYEEYKRGIKKRRTKTFLFILLVLIEAFVVMVFLGGIQTEAPHLQSNRSLFPHHRFLSQS